MAEAAVGLLLEKVLEHQVLSRSHSKPMNELFEKLMVDIRLLKAFLEHLPKKRWKDESLKHTVRLIRDAVHEFEDAVDTSISENRLGMNLDVLRIIIQKIEKLSAKVRGIYPDVDMSKDERSEQLIDEALMVREKNVVGFEDETSAVIGYLTEQTEELGVITLVGMPGIGKTTLAQNIFNHIKIKNEFRTRIWVHVSNEFTKKNVLLTILSQLTKDVTGNSSDEELTGLVLSHLEREKFLIVFDDVWSPSDWDSLFGILNPRLRNSKVLITTRDLEVGQRATRFRQSHQMRFLNMEESWELLQIQVFGEAKCPPELEAIGKLIVEQCGGLPLALVAVGDVILREELSSGDNIKARKIAWTKACHMVPTCLDEKIYDNLPTRLQVCFLYLAVFPEDFEIPIWQLRCMWIAEGLCSEENAESCLENLIHTNLLQIGQVKANGRPKTCRIHDLLQDLCKTEAGYQRENILTEVMFSHGEFEPPISQLSKCRRLSIHSNVRRFLSSKPSGPHVRSLVSFSDEEISSEDVSAIAAAFKLLRVLNVKPIKFSEIPRDMYDLVHLRYLALSLTNGKALSGDFSNLWNLQTLLVDTTSSTLEVKVDILRFTHLRHFKTNASANLSKAGRTGGGEMLQSLGTISPKSCTKELFIRARNLKKLGIRGELSLLLRGMVGSFDNFEALGPLDNLKLLNEVLPTSCSLPPADKFPPSLRSLTLARTYLTWDQMPILASLQMLQVLKLKDNAFVGEHWRVTDDGGFRNLEALHIGETDLVRWEASAQNFPQLKSLKLRHCAKLEKVPIELADIEILQLLDLFETKLAVESAKSILQKKHEEPSVVAQRFKLSIHPQS